jgi:pimeloyl-ACP methyl ester carboxylesterase
MHSDIRFCKSADGTRLGYTVTGDGPAIICTPTAYSSLQYDGMLPTWGPVYERFALRHKLVRYDARGTGVSERNVREYGLEERVADFSAVADAVGTQRFAIFGAAGGGAQIALTYAARNPSRVSHLVLFTPIVRGLSHRSGSSGVKLAKATLSAIRKDWGTDDPLFHQSFTRRYFPEASGEEMRRIAEFQRLNASPDAAEKLFAAGYSADVHLEIPKVRAPVLVFQRTQSVAGGLEQASEIVSQISGSKLVMFEGTAMYLLNHEEEHIETFLSETARFLGDKEDSSLGSWGKRLGRKVYTRSHAIVGSGHYKTAYGVLALLAAIASIVYYAKSLI